jgi:hypothetical protein
VNVGGPLAGVVFVSTGGYKMMRALRSFRRAEPSLRVHIALATSSRVWDQNNAAVPFTEFEKQPGVLTRQISSNGYINGCFNEAVKWMREYDYTHVCCLHDDTVFSPLPDPEPLSQWLEYAADCVGVDSSGWTLSSMEALVHPPPENSGYWHRPPEFWDSRDLESPEVWQRMCPGGRSAMYFGSEGSADGVSLGDWFVKYFATEHIATISRLGPCGFIIPVATWEAVGGFGETEGIFYDMEYPVLCALRGLPPVKVIPNTPFLHIHCQSTIGDPAVGIWEHDFESFKSKYGGRDPGTVLRELPSGGGY